MSDVLALLEQSGQWAITWSVGATLLIVLAWSFVLMDRAHRPAFRCIVWGAALLSTLALPVILKGVELAPWARQVREVFPLPAPIAFESIAALEVLPAPTQGESNRPIHVDSQRTALPALLQIPGAIWILGGLYALSRRIKAYRRLQKAAAAAKIVSLTSVAPGIDWNWVRGPVPPVHLTFAIQTPMLFGWLRPLILIPDDLDRWCSVEERTAMLRHECVHLERRDHWMSGIESLVYAILFFHPLVRLACRRLDVERELACDDAVLQLGSDADCYAEAILKVAERAVVARVAREAVFFSSARLLDCRIDRLFRTKPRSNSNRVAALISIGVLLTAAVMLGVVRVSPESVPGVPPILRVGLIAQPERTTSPKPKREAQPTVEEVRTRGWMALSNLPSEGQKMTVTEAGALETVAGMSADSLPERLKLIGYYSSLTDSISRAALRRQMLWIIEKHPENPIAAQSFSLRPDYEVGRQLWLHQLTTQGNEPVILLNAANFFQNLDLARSEEILQQGERLTPLDGTWAKYLGYLYMSEARDLGRVKYATKAVAAYERALRLARSEQDRWPLLAPAADAAFDAELWEKAASFSREALRTGDPDAIHSGNSVLGLLALQSDDVELAGTYLLNSARFPPGTLPYRPRIRLAAEFLRRGERESVLTYLAECAGLWKDQVSQDRFKAWAVLVENGLVPDFGAGR